MRIWHPKLYPYLCRKHLLACWREGLGCFSILLYNKKGYYNHPQVRMYRGNLVALYNTLHALRKEMATRGYRTRDILTSENDCRLLIAKAHMFEQVKEWQTLEEQLAILKDKACECYNNYIKGANHGLSEEN